MGKQWLLRCLRWLLGFFQAAWKTPFLFLFLNSFTYLGFPGGTSGKEPGCQCRRHKRYSFQSLCWEDPLEEEMSTHPRIFVWRIPWTEEPGGLQSIGLQRVGHDWSDWAWQHSPGALFLKKAILVPREKTQTSPSGHLNTCSWTSFNCHWVWAIHMLLRIVCMLSGGIKHSLLQAGALTMAKKLLENLFLMDRGNPFTGQTMWVLTKTSPASWNSQCLHHPWSLGKSEKTNG